MKRYDTFCLVLTTFVFTAVVQAADVKTDYDHQANFANYHTYSWGQVKTHDPLYVRRVKADINRDLQAKGWQLVPSGGAATVVATGSVKNEQDLETTYNNMGGGWGGGWGWGGWDSGFGGGGFGEADTTTTNQPVGHLVVDIFDSSTHKLLFRSIADDDVSNKTSKNTKNLSKDVDKMFKDFPPQAKASTN